MTQDSDAPDTDRALYLGADNREAGRQAGELIKQALPQGGKIRVFVGKREVQNAEERFEGLKEALQGSKIVIIDLMTDDANPSKARDNAYETLKKYPDIAGMVGLWSYNGPAIVQGLNLKRASYPGRLAEQLIRSRTEAFVGNVYSLVVTDFGETCTLLISFTDDPREIKLTLAEFGRRPFRGSSAPNVVLSFWAVV